MPSWGGPFHSKSSKKKKAKAAAPVIRFVDFSGRRDSDGESHSSSVPGDSVHPGCHSPHCGQDKDEVPCSSRCPQLLSDPQQEHEESEADGESLRHLDHLGVALENTFKEVDSIDAYVTRLREEFDHELMSEQRFMSCICSARIARAACCKMQIQAWRQLQQGIMEFCQHHHHELVDHLPLTCSTHHLPHQHHSEVFSPSSHEGELDSLMEQLNRLPSFRVVKQRLDPRSEPRAFVEQWIIQSPLSDHHHPHVSPDRSSETSKLQDQGKASPTQSGNPSKPLNQCNTSPTSSNEVSSLQKQCSSSLVQSRDASNLQSQYASSSMSCDISKVPDQCSTSPEQSCDAPKLQDAKVQVMDTEYEECTHL